jgi:hypothetical protein
MPAARRVALLAAVGALAVAPTGCGSARSVQAYCDAFWSRAVPLHDRYEAHSETADENPLAALADVFSVPGDLATLMDAMAAVAPEEIRPDTESVRDNLERLQDSNAHALSDPLGALGDNIGLALSSGSGFARVDAYLAQHCPPPAGVDGT